METASSRPRPAATTFWVGRSTAPTTRFVWSVDATTGGAHVLDPLTLEVQDVVPPFASPISTGDMTGAALFAARGPTPTLEQVFRACPEGQVGTVNQLTYEADLPPGTRLELALRLGDRTGDLGVAERIALPWAPDASSPIDVEATLREAGYDWSPAFVLVEATLRALRADTQPTLRSLGLMVSCSFI